MKTVLCQAPSGPLVAFCLLPFAINHCGATCHGRGGLILVPQFGRPLQWGVFLLSQLFGQHIIIIIRI